MTSDITWKVTGDTLDTTCVISKFCLKILGWKLSHNLSIDSRSYENVIIRHDM
jgi:hypothetical protein